VTAVVEQVDARHAYFTGVKLAPMHRQLETLGGGVLGERSRANGRGPVPLEAHLVRQPIRGSEETVVSAFDGVVMAHGSF